MEHLPKEPAPSPAEALDKIFYRQIAVEQFPEWQETPDPIDCAVSGMAMLTFADGTVELRGNQLFIFNALVYLRYLEGGVVRSSALSLGYSGTTTLWSTNMAELIEKINTAAGATIIQVKGDGRGTRYRINDRLRLIDQREDVEEQEIWYEFAQTLSSQLLHVPETLEFGPEDQAPVELIIRDNDTVVANHIGVQFNHHELTLFNLLLLLQGESIASDEIKALGFHAYAESKLGKTKALERAVRSINKKIPTPQPFISSTRSQESLYYFGQRVRLTDVRPQISQEASFGVMHAVLFILFNQIEDSPFTPPNDTLDESAIKDGLRTHGASLTLVQAYALCLRYKVLLPHLRGTHIEHRNGSVTNYEDLVAHITSDQPLSQDYIADLLGVANGSTPTVRGLVNLKKIIKTNI